MKKIFYREEENGTRYVETEGKEMEVLEEISKTEFEEKFPNISTDIDGTEIFLEIGIVLTERDWNGEEWCCNGKDFRPVYKEDVEYNSFEAVGYYEV